MVTYNFRSVVTQQLINLNTFVARHSHLAAIFPISSEHDAAVPQPPIATPKEEFNMSING